MPIRILKKAYNYKIVKFCIVGSVGLFINLCVFYVCANFFAFKVNISAVLAFVVASINNYVLNTFWTFGVTKTPVTRVNYAKYLSSNLAGLVVNIVVLNIIFNMLGDNFAMLSQLIAVLSATAFNFILSHKFVFRGT